MARERSSGAGASIIGMMVFGFLFFIAMVLAIVFYTKVADAERRAVEADTVLAKFASRSERDQKDIAALLGTYDKEKKTVVAQLKAETERLRTMLQAGSSVEDITRRLELLSIDPNRGILPAYAELQQSKITNDDLAQSLQAEADQLNAQMQALTEEKIALEAKYNDSVAGLKAEIDDLNAQINRHVQGIQALQDDLIAVVAETKDKFDVSIEQSHEQIRLKDETIVRLQKALDDLVRDRPGVDPQTDPDGEILSILSEGTFVTINRGRNDKLLAGTTFEVFDHETGVVVDENEQLRGKATIEVINVNDSSAVARVVQIERGAVVHEKDIIINVVYDRNRTQKFAIFGEFDLDDDGRPLRSDTQRVEAMVTLYGGRLVDELSYDTDFLVLGMRPEYPEPLGDDVIDPRLIAEHAAKLKLFTEYHDLEGKAKELKVPILNQNRFLYLVGYYDRG